MGDYIQQNTTSANSADNLANLQGLYQGISSVASSNISISDAGAIAGNIDIAKSALNLSETTSNNFQNLATDLTNNFSNKVADIAEKAIAGVSSGISSATNATVSGIKSLNTSTSSDTNTNIVNVLIVGAVILGLVLIFKKGK